MWKRWRRSGWSCDTNGTTLRAFRLGGGKLTHARLLLLWLQLCLSHGVKHLPGLLASKRVGRWRVAGRLYCSEGGWALNHLGLGWGLPPGRASLSRLWLERGHLVPARGHLTCWVEGRSGAELGELRLLLGLLLLVMLLLQLLQSCRVELPPSLQRLHVMGSLRGHRTCPVGNSLLMLKLLLLLNRHTWHHRVHHI